MALMDPLIAVVASFCVLGAMLYKRVNLGITLNATALILALLSIDWQEIPKIIFSTAADLLTISVVLATFGIMLLSQLYKETGFVNRLSESLSRIIKNPKIVLSLLPAVIGFLPVAGGALISAPIVDSEAEKLKLKPEKKAYVNLWFRHTIFPVYPLNQVLITAAALSGTTVVSIIILQIPVVAVMVTVGYIISFLRIPNPRNEESTNTKRELNLNLKNLLFAFFPILTTIIVAVSLDLSNPEFSKLGFDVLIATSIGIIVLVLISKLNLQTFVKPFKNHGIYGITLAAYGAFLLGNVMRNTGIQRIFETVQAGGNIDNTILLTVVPGVLGMLTASTLGGISISIPILGGIIAVSPSIPKMASLIYMSAYLGYVIAPTHLCFAFTADYFKCSLVKIYRYVIPSFLITFTTVLAIYFML